MRDGEFYCPDHYAEKFCNRCGYCDQPITEGNYIRALGKFFHYDHFHCEVCKKPFHDGKYYEDNGKVYCEEHNNNQTTEIYEDTCIMCSQPILNDDMVVTLRGQPCHRNCLRCKLCNVILPDSTTIYQRSNMVFCSKHFHNYFCKLCCKCGAPLIGKKMVSIRDSHYHVDCLTCGICDKKVESYYIFNGQLRCQVHRFTPSKDSNCYICHQALHPNQCTLALGTTFHPECFKCYMCLRHIPTVDARFTTKKRLACIECLLHATPYNSVPDILHTLKNSPNNSQFGQANNSNVFSPTQNNLSPQAQNRSQFMSLTMPEQQTLANAFQPSFESFQTNHNINQDGESIKQHPSYSDYASPALYPIDYQYSQHPSQYSQDISMLSPMSHPTSYTYDNPRYSDQFSPQLYGQTSEYNLPSVSQPASYSSSPGTYNHRLSMGSQNYIQSNVYNNSQHQSLNNYATPYPTPQDYTSPIHSSNQATSVLSSDSNIKTPYYASNQPTILSNQQPYHYIQPSRLSGYASEFSFDDCQHPSSILSEGITSQMESVTTRLSPKISSLANNSSIISTTSSTSAPIASTITPTTNSNFQDIALSPSSLNSLTLPEDDDSDKRNMFVSCNDNDEEFDFKRGQLIGKGSFGRVYCALNNKTGEMIAIKQIDVDVMSDKDASALTQLQTEIQLMRELRHPNIVSLLGTQIQYTPKVKMNIIMEYVPGNSIERMLKQFGAFSENVIVNYTRQLLHALAYCHTKGVIHRDIKGKNVLLHTSGVLKLADFGSAKMLDGALLKDATSSGYSYTPLWIAPEVLYGKYDARVDIWSLGCVIVEMATADLPWAECNITNPYRAMFHIANTTEIPRIPERLSALGKDFLSLCFQRDPEKRPFANELLCHPWVAENTNNNSMVMTPNS